MIKVEMPNNQARQLRDEWEHRLFSLKEEAAELETAIASIDAQLKGALDGAAIVEPSAGKRKKGSNFRTIHTFLKGVGVSGATMAEISKNTHIPVSSCMYQLKQHAEIFAKDQKDGLWRCRPNP
jgi:hypothetical protein